MLNVDKISKAKRLRAPSQNCEKHLWPHISPAIPAAHPNRWWWCVWVCVWGGGQVVKNNWFWKLYVFLPQTRKRLFQLAPNALVRFTRVLWKEKSTSLRMHSDAQVKKLVMLTKWTLKIFERIHVHEPAHEIMVLITQATSEGSCEPAQWAVSPEVSLFACIL